MGIIVSKKDVFDVENFEEEMKSYSMPMVIDFFASWCAPCKMLSPILDSVMEQYEGLVRFVKIDIDLYPDIAAKYEVVSVPTLLFFGRNGLARREIGFKSEAAIVEIIENELLKPDEISSEVWDLLIIGAGPAGIAAAVYALRAGLTVSVCEKSTYGSQTAIIENIENYPGIKKISGFDFASALFKQAESFGANFIFDEVVEVDLKPEIKKIYFKNSGMIEARSVVIANGLKRRTLGCKGEKEFFGRGVSCCATCDGAFFKGKKVVVVGGGNTALEEALYLSNICSEVVIIVRKDYFRAEKFLCDAVNAKKNISVKFCSHIREISGEKTVKKVEITVKDKTISEEVDGVFVAIGYEPDNEIYRGQVGMTDSGYFTADETCKTDLGGVYVAGDCRLKPLRQIVTAVADGAVAGSNAAAWLISQSK